MKLKKLSHDSVIDLIGLVSLRQTAMILGVHPHTLRRWDKEGTFPAVKIGTHRKYRKIDILKML